VITRKSPEELDGMRRAGRLVGHTLSRVVEAVRPGVTLLELDALAERVIRDPGYGVVREYVGHGIGTRMHEEPQVPNYGRPGRGLRLEVGLALAIEPMVNEGGPSSRVLDDGWTVVTRDGSRSAHFEHTVAITPQGPEVLTLLDGARQEDWLPTAAQRR
jgi:methionyl aminopeptidase